MAVNDEQCVNRRMKACCLPDCYDDDNHPIKSCLECELSGLMKK